MKNIRRKNTRKEAIKYQKCPQATNTLKNTAKENLQSNENQKTSTAFVATICRETLESSSAVICQNKFLSRATAIVVIGPRQIGKPTETVGWLKHAVGYHLRYGCVVK